MSLSLYRKYRPQTFSDVIGQGHIVQTLSNAIKHNRIAHAYLFTGPRGTGKTTLARIFARAVNCKNPKGTDPCLECDVCKNISEGKSLDIFEIDAASNTGVDNIRELRENVKFPPSQAKYKVYIIDEVHMLSTGAFNALLKTLEEPPAHVIFILATTEIHKVPETIISRCQRFDFTRLSIKHIVEKISAIAKSEGVSVEKNALEMIAIAAEGGMRDAESLFSQIIALEDKKITAKEVEDMLGTTQRQSLEKLASYLLSKNASSAISLINELSANGYDLDVFNKSLLNYLRQLMLVSIDPKLSKLFSYELTKEQSENLISQTKDQDPQKVLFLTQCFSEIQGKIRSSFIPQLPLEMAIVKAVQGLEAVKEYPPSYNGIKTAQQPARQQAPDTPKSSLGSQNPPISSGVIKSKHTPIESENTPQPQIPETEEPLESSSFTINDVRKGWEQAIKDMKTQNHSLSAILQSCQPTKVAGGIITIATKFTFHKEKLAEIGNKLTLESIFARILGSQLRINILTAQEAGIKMDKQISGHDSEKKSSETSSLLSDAIGIMGGQIVE